MTTTIKFATVKPEPGVVPAVKLEPGVVKKEEGVKIETIKTEKDVPATTAAAAVAPVITTASIEPPTQQPEVAPAPLPPPAAVARTPEEAFLDEVVKLCVDKVNLAWELRLKHRSESTAVLSSFVILRASYERRMSPAQVAAIGAAGVRALALAKELSGPAPEAAPGASTPADMECAAEFRPWELQAHIESLDDMLRQDPGNQALRDLYNGFVLPLRHLEYAVSVGLQLRGILLYGPPGTGKTHRLRGLAKSLSDVDFYQLSQADVASKWVGETQKCVRKAFATASQINGKPAAVLFVDEIESLARARTTGGANDGTVAELLKSMDDLESRAGSKPVVLVGATNHPASVDAALVSRMSGVSYVGLPTPTERAAVVASVFDRTIPPSVRTDALSVRLAQVALVLAHLTRGFSSREVAATAQATLDAATRVGLVLNADMQFIDNEAVVAGGRVAPCVYLATLGAPLMRRVLDGQHRLTQVSDLRELLRYATTYDPSAVPRIQENIADIEAPAVLADFLQDTTLSAPVRAARDALVSVNGDMATRLPHVLAAMRRVLGQFA